MLRSLVLVLLSLLSALTAQDAPTFVHAFGAPGDKGSFRVMFDDRGGSVYFVQTMDHVASTAALAVPPAERMPGDHMLLVGDGADYSFVLREVDTAIFVENPAFATWTRRVEPGAVTFELQGKDGIVLRKRYLHRPAQRGIALEIELQNTGTTTLPVANLSFVLAGPAVAHSADASMFGTSAWAIAVPEGGTQSHVAADAKGVVQPLLALDGQPWSMIGSSNRFFGAFLFPLDDGAMRAVTRVDVESLPAAERTDLHILPRSMPRSLVSLRLPSPQPSATSKASFGVYLGPKSHAVFAEEKEHERFVPILDVDLEPPCCFGIVVPGGRFMASTLVKLLNVFHSAIGQWGLAIMLLTVLVRGLLAPLNFRMQKSMREYGKRMAVVKPKMDKLKEKYADDPKAYQQAMLQLQREHKIMPPLGGCLPIFLTMPIYIGLFTALRTAYDLRHQGFLWMEDLCAPDGIAEIPFWPHLFNLLPLVWITLMLILQSRMPLPTDPQQRQVQQIMRYMPLMFGVLLYNYAAGLMVYMVTSMLWTFVESAVTKKILGPIDPNAAAMAPTPMM